MITTFSLSVMTFENLMRSVRCKNGFLECDGNLVNMVLHREPEKSSVVNFHLFPYFSGGGEGETGSRCICSQEAEAE